MVNDGLAVVTVPRTVLADAADAFITSGCNVIKLPVIRPVLSTCAGREGKTMNALDSHILY